MTKQDLIKHTEHIFKSANNAPGKMSVFAIRCLLLGLQVNMLHAINKLDEPKESKVIESEDREYDEYDRCTGLWHTFTCSACKFEYDEDEPIRNFCPNCGAKIIETGERK